MREKPNKTTVFGLLLVVVMLAFTLPSVKNVFQSTWTIKDFQTQKLDWKGCYETYKCAVLKVPMDYDHIDKNIFHILVLKHEALNSKQRLGSIVVNPGGPGGSGTDYAYAAESIVSSAINQKFDIVGFDPRGVASSDPLRCLNDKQTDAYLAEDGKADTPQQEADSLKSSKFFAQACAKAAGVRLGHYSTLESAKDMELLRMALGEKKLNFLGKSYGTFLGTLYASLYPNSVGRFVLDGAVDPNVSIRDQNLAQAKGFDLALGDFLKSTKGITRDQILSLINRAETKPLSSASNRKVTPALIVIGIASSLYDNTEGWPLLQKALRQAMDTGNGQLLLELSDQYTNRDKNGHYSDNQNDIALVVSCLDWNESRSLAQMKLDRAIFAKAAPVFGPFLTFSGLSCHYWSAPPVVPPVLLRDLKTPPILVIGVTGDPATPYDWAVALHKDFPASVFLTFVGEGHTGHNRGSVCIDGAVDRYFLTGQAPAHSLRCVA